MIAIASELIEIAEDRHRNLLYMERHRVMLDLQRKVLASALPGRSDDFYEGAMLGIESARVFLEGNPPAVMLRVSL